MAMGQAAGAAAVLNIHSRNMNTRSLDTAEIRQYLADQGAFVPGLNR